jgi:acyl-CoA dehydrogenase
MDVLRRALEVTPPAVDTLTAWWDATTAEREAQPTTIDRALIAGAVSDRLGFAFAGGYREALRALVPGLQGVAAALCATEEGGAHPRAIKTTLTRVHGDGFSLTGKKKWATAASDARILLVIASTGERDGKNELAMVSVHVGMMGVKLTPTTAAFVPEIPHAEVEFDNVAVSESDVHSGDGYEDYLKPFRTIEDLHVHAALLGYLIGVARRHGFARDVMPGLVASAAMIRALAEEDLKSAVTHLALGGAIDQVTRVVAAIDDRWSAGDEHARWQRDRMLLKVAGSARTARLARAIERLGL